MIISGARLVNTGYVVDVKPIYTTGLFASYDPETGISGSTFLDSSGNGFDATIYNSPSTVTLAGGHKVLQLNSASSQWFAYMPGYSVAGVDGPALSFDAWFNTSTAATAQTIISEYGQAASAAPDYFNGGWNDAIMGVNYSTINAGFYASGNGGYVTGPVYNTNTWYHVCITAQSGLYTLYINGASYGTVVTTRTSSPSTMYWAFGYPDSSAGFYLSGVTNYFNGYLGPVKLYTGTLTAAQVLQNFNALRWRYGI